MGVAEQGVKSVRREDCRDFDRRVLEIECAAVSQEIEQAIREIVANQLHRRGVVVGVSGGVDSAVCAVLAARALGPDRVFGLLMPERDSDPDSTARGQLLCDQLKIAYEVENIEPTLETLGCYRRRDRAIRRLFPDFGPGHRSKIAIAGNLLDEDRVNYFNLIVESPTGRQQTKRMPLDVYLQVVAATNMKQRTRKLVEYYHAERRNFAVLGTPNRLEYDQGFFVRGGDGLADLKPIAHLYKTQVYALARYLGVPETICSRPPSTDTYSLQQTQDEFFFALPYDQMDLLLYAFTNGIPEDDVAPPLQLTVDQVRRVNRDIQAKRQTAARLHRPAVVVGDAYETASPRLRPTKSGDELLGDEA